MLKYIEQKIKYAMWTKNGIEVKAEEIDDKAIGFIYVLTNVENGRKYLGKKLLTKAAYRIIKGKKKAYRKASDWQEYYSSSPEIKELIKDHGKQLFKREILTFCYSKSELNYFEEKLQYVYGVLESDTWYNSNIRSRIFKKNILGKIQDIKHLL